MRSSLLLCLAVIATTAFGQTWSPVLSNRSIYSIATNPLNTRTVFAGNQARVFFRSYDGGQSWEELTIGSFGGASQIMLMQVHPTDTNVAFAGGQGLETGGDTGGATHDKGGKGEKEGETLHGVGRMKE